MWCSMVLLSLSMKAQMPEMAEDISPLLIGEQIPDLKLSGSAGDSMSLHELFKEAPTVLIFYRGGWCPYCNTHLAEIGQLEEMIKQLGYQVIGVSPEDSEYLMEAASKNDLKYRLISDSDGRLSQGMGIAFKAPERYTQRLSERSSGQNQGFLPVPSLFIVDTNGLIQFEHINPDYKQRMNGELLLTVLEALKGGGQ
ncbi:MAG: AhpC/TSA family protein [Saprospiraceae bacterium]|nr:AhpC/TSA family protein [Saprospiraceae bacterium]